MALKAEIYNSQSKGCTQPEREGVVNRGYHRSRRASTVVLFLTIDILIFMDPRPLDHEVSATVG